MINKKNRTNRFFLVAGAGIGLASRVVDTSLGLATASRFRLVTEYRSGVRFPTYAKSLAYSPAK